MILRVRRNFFEITTFPNTSTLQSAFVMPGGLDGGALGFLCFGWATEAVAVAAARGVTYFFGGMVAGWEASGREIGARKGENGREVGEKWEETVGRGARLANKADPRALFACVGAPGAPQGAGFCLGPPAPVSARAGEKRASRGATGPFFQRRRGKNA